MVDLIIEGGHNSIRYIVTSSTSPGHEEDQEAYRSKPIGLYHAILIFKDIYGIRHIAKGFNNSLFGSL